MVSSTAQPQPQQKPHVVRRRTTTTRPASPSRSSRTGCRWTTRRARCGRTTRRRSATAWSRSTPRCRSRPWRRARSASPTCSSSRRAGARMPRAV
ncbi:hypothetical protein BDA96_02G116700 [Sorghum bicolor]|uniref:Uncharacterized protein n=1 Tax=Sorghum bicolor TaxID=4558 RepID=A0A921RP35_SORBI|nr:hypothetical protein BDA96_02G116700 [Sorghum bicolor]